MNATELLAWQTTREALSKELDQLLLKKLELAMNGTSAEYLSISLVVDSKLKEYKEHINKLK